MVDVAFDEVDAAPEAAQLEAPLLLLVAGVGWRNTNDARGGVPMLYICTTNKSSGGERADVHTYTEELHHPEDARMGGVEK